MVAAKPRSQVIGKGSTQKAVIKLGARRCSTARGREEHPASPGTSTKSQTLQGSGGSLRSGMRALHNRCSMVLHGFTEVFVRRQGVPAKVHLPSSSTRRGFSISGRTTVTEASHTRTKAKISHRPQIELFKLHVPSCSMPILSSKPFILLQ